MKSLKSKKTLLVGPLIPPFTGQAVAFSLIAESFKPEEAIVINTAKYKSTYLNTLSTIATSIFAFLFKSFTVIYFTSSRSKLGFIKELPLLILGRWGNKEIINHLHGADFKRFYSNSGALKPIISYAYKGIDISIVLLDSMKEQYSDFPNMKIKTVSNCNSKELVKFENSVKKSNRQILYLSNLMCSKGILDFLDASKDLLQNYSDIEIKIAGSLMADDCMSLKRITTAFEKKFKELKTSFGERITYLEVVKGVEKFRLLFESDIFVLPTYYPTEAYPISIIEAMRTGNAIITTDHNYLPQIINEKHGIIIPPKSPDDIATAVSSLLCNPDKLKRIQQSNIKEAKEKYSQDRYIREIKKIIYNL